MGREDTPEVPVAVVRAGPENVELARGAVSGIYGRYPVEAGALAAFLADPSCFLLLAREGGAVVGSLNGYALRSPHAAGPQFLLHEIDVREGWRRRGIGTRLVAAFVEEARRAGASEVWVPTNASNEAAMGMYRACGFARPHPDDVMLTLSTRKETPS